jgi:hypothetical protein
MSSNYLVYQAYSSIDNLNEVVYSIASFFRLSNQLPVNIVVYTDNESYLRRLLPPNIIYEDLPAEKQRMWRGEIDFVHRLKIEMLIDFCSKYPGNILYLDTDTVFTLSTDSLFQSIAEGKGVMHTCEGPLSVPITSVFVKLSRKIKGRFFLVRGDEMKVPDDQEVWNAGVIGFKSGQANLLFDVLEMTDLIYKIYQSHITEQLSFSVVFSRNFTLVSAWDQVFHYWNFKEFRVLLKQFLAVNSSFEMVQSNFLSIDPKVLILPKREFESQPKWKKQWQKHFLGKKWYMPGYEDILNPT